jgi:hypothetical protein
MKRIMKFSPEFRVANAWGKRGPYFWGKANITPAISASQGNLGTGRSFPAGPGVQSLRFIVALKGCDAQSLGNLSHFSQRTREMGHPVVAFF